MSSYASVNLSVRFIVLASFCVLTASLCPTALNAQAAMPGSAAEQQVLEEIVVTATRRETSLQLTPIAVSVMDRGLIKQVSPRDIGDLAPYVPNFSVARIAGFNAASFAMRGLGQNNIIVYFDSPVAVLVDDFVIPSVQTQLLDTFDIEQIEVLRGPQGTLFGKNTTAGVISVRTIAPEFNEYTANLEAGFGSFGTYSLKAAANIPLVDDRLALRIVGAYKKSDGWMTNGAEYGPIVAFVPDFPFAGATGQGDGRDLGGEDVFNGRVKLNWKANDSLSVLLQYEVLRDRSEPAPMVNSTFNPFFVWPLFGLPAPTGDFLNRAGSNAANKIVDLTTASVDVDGYYLNVDWNIGGGTITSVTGYRTQESRLPFTPSTTPSITVGNSNLNLFDARRDDDRKTFQQEFRFASDFEGPFDFVGGAFYQDDKIDFCVVTVLGFLDMFGLTTPYGPYNEVPAFTCSKQNAKSYAVFAEGTYDFSERLTLTAGIRMTRDEKTWRGRQDVFQPELPGFTNFTSSMLAAGDFERYPDGVIMIDREWDEPSWRISLGYQATLGTFVYASASRGYKAGGFNDQIGLGAPYGDNLELFSAAADATEPEFADSYELGLRTDGFDDRLRANLTAFWVKYTDLQRQLNVPVTVTDDNGVETSSQVTRYFNAAEAQVYGFEAELMALPAEGLTLRAVVGYQHGEYKSYTTPVPAGYDLATAPLDRTPEWSWMLDGTYTRQLAERGFLTFNASASYVDENLYTQSISTETSNTFLHSRTLLNASVVFTDPKDRYYIKLFGRNLTDERYLTADLVVAELFAWSQYGSPREYGVEFGYRFGAK